MERISRSRWAGSVALGVGVAGACAGIALSADGAAAQTTSHRMRMTTRQIQDRLINGVDVATDKDLHDGVVTGYDVTSCRVSPQNHLAVCDVAIARAGGLLYVHTKVDVNTGRGTGAVTGGTRHFRDASGSVSIALPHIVITWSN